MLANNEILISISEDKRKITIKSGAVPQEITYDACPAKVLEELANAIQSVKDLDTVKEQTYQELWSNYKTFQQKYVDAEDLTLAIMCSSGGSEKGKAVQMWVMGLWQKYYTVKDAITSAQSVAEIEAIDIHAESYGEPPYTIRELNEEATAYLDENNKE